MQEYSQIGDVKIFSKLASTETTEELGAVLCNSNIKRQKRMKV